MFIVEFPLEFWVNIQINRYKTNANNPVIKLETVVGAR